MTSVGSGYSGKPSEAIRSDGDELAKKAPEDRSSRKIIGEAMEDMHDVHENI